jgi:hypothetical protein
MLILLTGLVCAPWPQAKASQQSNPIISVPQPNGSDDTNNIQRALNACVA